MNSGNVIFSSEKDDIQSLVQQIETDAEELNMVKENMIEIEHLSKSFGKVKAVNDLSFHVEHGELFAFLGGKWSRKKHIDESAYR